MDFLPIFFDLKDRPCLLVGGGELAARKAALLLSAGARVTLVAPHVGAGMTELLDTGAISHTKRRFRESDLDRATLVIAATGRRDVDRVVSECAHARQIPVNVVDDPELSSFIMPSIVDRSPVIVAISTGGAAPVLARLIRARLETLIPASFGRLASLAADFRQAVKERFKQSSARRIFWEQVLDGPISEMVYAGQDNVARRALEAKINDAQESPPLMGEVYLVGAGPGDPDLLTSRAVRLMQRADVVVYDRLVSAEVLNLVRRDAERIYAGKERSRHVMPQEGINQLLIRLANEGRRVLRLKGGDPFIFGRGGEEIDTLAEHGIPFQIVPGITAASGCAAYAGIPLTHRDYAHACVFVTGHLKNDLPNLDWEMLAKPHQTLVIYMGLVGLAQICQGLVAHGMAPTTPAALIEQGTTMQQRLYKGTLETLPALVAAGGARAPTLIIVGEVVTLHDKLAWFEPQASGAQHPTSSP